MSAVGAKRKCDNDNAQPALKRQKHKNSPLSDLVYHTYDFISWWNKDFREKANINGFSSPEDALDPEADPFEERRYNKAEKEFRRVHASVCAVARARVRDGDSTNAYFDAPGIFDGPGKPPVCYMSVIARYLPPEFFDEAEEAGVKVPSGMHKYLCDAVMESVHELEFAAHKLARM